MDIVFLQHFNIRGCNTCPHIIGSIPTKTVMELVITWTTILMKIVQKSHKIHVKFALMICKIGMRTWHGFSGAKIVRKVQCRIFVQSTFTNQSNLYNTDSECIWNLRNNLVYNIIYTTVILEENLYLYLFIYHGKNTKMDILVKKSQ